MKDKSGSGNRERQIKGLKILASSITLMVDRFHSLGHDDKVPNFKDQLETQLESSEPLDIYREWKNNVENLIDERSHKRRRMS